ncbi:hypothetical protein Gotri_019093 [Gossypium trilobum]|uniref:RNase H type-1 domain-containing protein n=1 Tax=Gossypium trilobum TaxID=34281 RepID=A0A7J9EBQ4_9ROSI|nr:hypothetical protein [Gossypium trilobum]
MIKINFDTSFHGKFVCYGLMAKDADGFVHGGCMGYVNKEMQIEWAELLAMEESIKFARSKNWKIVELESDCASLVNRFNRRQEDLTMLGHRVREIKKQTYFLFRLILIGSHVVVIRSLMLFVLGPKQIIILLILIWIIRRISMNFFK